MTLMPVLYHSRDCCAGCLALYCVVIVFRSPFLLHPFFYPCLVYQLLLLRHLFFRSSIPVFVFDLSTSFIHLPNLQSLFLRYSLSLVACSCIIFPISFLVLHPSIHFSIPIPSFGYIRSCLYALHPFTSLSITVSALYSVSCWMFLHILSYFPSSYFIHPSISLFLSPSFGCIHSRFYALLYPFIHSSFLSPLPHSCFSLFLSSPSIPQTHKAINSVSHFCHL